MAIVKIVDVIVPEIFSPYFQQLTEEKSRLIQSGVVVRDPAIDTFLQGGGLTFNLPSWKDLANDADNVSSDNEASTSTPNKIGTSLEIGVRLSRNSSWSAMDLVGALAGSDPMGAIGSRVAAYWTRRAQAMFVATMQGLFADNDAAPSGTEHVAGDLTEDISGSAYQAGVTDFSAESFIDAMTTMGDSMDDLTTVMVHSITFARMKKNTLIDFIPDSQNPAAQAVPTFLGKQVIVDDGVPNPAGTGAAQTSAGIFHVWLFGVGAVRWGVGAAPVPVEVDRAPAAGNGGGQETLYTRVEWCLHPTGHKYAGTPANGGPANGTGANDLANAGSWQRVYPERKQIKVARLITREA